MARIAAAVGARRTSGADGREGGGASYLSDLSQPTPPPSSSLALSRTPATSSPAGSPPSTPIQVVGYLTRAASWRSAMGGGWLWRRRWRGPVPVLLPEDWLIWM